MAFDFSKLNFFSGLGARARIFVLFSGLVGIVGVVYIGVSYLSSGSETTGPSKVASAPQGLQSVPGGQLTPEYYRALQQANQQAAQQAQISGGSAVATLVNVGQPSMSGNAGSCNIICDETNANIKSYMDDWVRQGKLSPDVASQLQKLGDGNATEAEFASALQDLVKAGKLTPEQARMLLEQYRRQHRAAQMKASGAFMDTQISAGNLPLDAATNLLALQKSGATPDEYAAALRNMVAMGVMSEAMAQQLLAQYSQARAKEVISMSVESLKHMAAAGQLTPEVESGLIDLEQRMVSVDQYNAALNQYIQQGKLIPATAAAIMDEFKRQKAMMGSVGTVTNLLKEAEAAAFAEIADLLKTGKITQSTADTLKDLINKNVSFDDFKSAIQSMVESKDLTPEIAKLKIADYQAVKGLRDMQAKLMALQANNASDSEYQDALNQSVQAGLITADDAAQLLKEYQARNAVVVMPATDGKATNDFSKLQQRLQQASAETAPSTTTATSSDFADAAAKVAAANAAAQQNEIQAIAANMSTQAQSLIAAWQPVPMVHQEGAPPEDPSKSGALGANGAAAAPGSAASTTSVSGTEPPKPALIKAGQIIFAVLDTGVNSDYPDSPVMATIVDGQYKGAKMLGTLVTTKGVSGQMDRVSLNFTLMNVTDWPNSKAITAYGIDPDTARTVIASSVDYHYMQRFGAIMATSFVQGYASAISSSASTSTTGIFGTSTTHPELSPSQKLATGIGQIGTALGTVTQNYTNIPPTVKVDAGVSLGILFMADVT
jgi:intracellular multiplication protein IcmE